MNARNGHAEGLWQSAKPCASVLPELELGRKMAVEAAEHAADDAVYREVFGRIIGVGVPAWMAKTYNGHAWHIVVDGVVSRGRFERFPGELLCKPGKPVLTKGTNASWRDQQVTCATCKQTAQKLQKSVGDSA